MAPSDLKVILIHGNGGSTGNNYWLPNLKSNLEEIGFVALNPTFPDNQIAHESIWLKYLEDVLKADDKTIIVGHSSGGLVALRYAESHKLYGSVLVGVNHTDLNDEIEKESGYYTRPWEWEKIKSNQNWILQFASADDPFIPIEEPRFIHQQLGSDYHEFTDRGHFMVDSFPELFPLLKEKISPVSS